MKKSLFLLFGLLTSVTVLADKFDKPYQGHTYQYDRDNHNATLIKAENVDSVDIPAQIYDNYQIAYDVTAIDANAFSGCSKLKRLTLPETLRSIGSNAFKDCKDLKHIWCKIENPRNVLSAEGLPYGNTLDNLVTLYVPTEASVNIYEKTDGWSQRFSGRILYGNMSEPIKVDGMFYICAEGSKKATLYSAKNETDIVVPEQIDRNGVKYDVIGIDRQAFKGFDQIKSITIQDNVTAIGAEAFLNCSKLEEIKLPSTLTTINTNAFYGCSNLIRVECRATTAFRIPDNLFTYNTNKYEKTLYVPNTSTYQNSQYEGWQKFTYFMQGEMYPDSYYNPDLGVTMSFVCATGSMDATLIKVSGANVDKLKELTVPYKNGNYVVTVIDKNAFANAKSLERLIFNDGGTSSRKLKIGKNALSGCSSLKVLVLPERLSSIGDNAFSDCKNLTHVCFKNPDPYGVVIGENVFFSTTKSKATLYVSDDYRNYSQLDWGSKTYYFDSISLFEENGLSYIGWEESISETETEKKAVLIKGAAGSSNKFTVNNTANSYNVIEIGADAFNGIGTFNELTIQQGILKIGVGAFQGLTSLEKVTLPSSLESIDENAFNGCNKISDINFDYVTWIGTSAFKNCTSLPNVIDFSAVKTIGASAFQGCTSFERIVLPASLSSLGENAFSGCNNLIEVVSKCNNPCDIVDKTVFPNDDIILYVPSLNAKSNYSSMGWNFWKTIGGNRKTEPVIVKDKVVMTYAYGDDPLETMAVLLKNDPQNTSPIIEKYVPNTANNKLVSVIAKSAFANNTSLESITIPDDVEKIGKNAFKGCTKLNKVNFPKQLKYVGDYAFDGCNVLTKLEFPEGTETIGEYAFRNCKNIVELVFPESLSSIGDKAFWESANLTTINSKIPASSLFTLKNQVFSPLPNIKIYIPFGSKDKYKEKWGHIFSNDECFIPGKTGYGYDENKWYYKFDCEYAQDGSIVGTATLLSADQSTVVNGIQTVRNEVDVRIDAETVLEALKLTGIGESAFDKYQGKGDFSSLTIESNVTTIGKNAFRGCSKLSELHIDGATIIGEYAFLNCNKLQKVWLPSSLKTIKEKAFDGCNITYLCCEATALPYSESEIVADNSKAYLFIPTGKTEVYKGKDGWRYFPKIYEGYFVNEYTPKTDEYEKMTFLYLKNEKEGEEKTAILKESKTEGDVIIPDEVSYNGEDNYIVKEIVESAFSGSSKLHNITIPASVEKIGDKAFANCSSISNVTYQRGEPITINENVFPALITAKLYVLDDLTGDVKKKYAEDPVWGTTFKILKGERIETEPNEKGLVFEYATGEENATLIKGVSSGEIEIDDIVGSDKHVDEIAKSAFKGQTGITSIKIPEGVESIGDNAFENCTGLVKIELPKSLKTIGNQAFGGWNKDKIKTIISKIPADDLASVNADFTKVFKSENSQSISISPKIYIPVGESSKTLYKEKWNFFDENDFIQGYPEYAQESKGESRWYYDCLTTIDESAIGDTGEDVLYGTATLVSAEKRADVDGILPIDGVVVINGHKYEVTGISGTAFHKYQEKASAVQLKIGENIETIGDNAFNGFSLVEKIWLPSTLKTIGAKAFGSSKITHVCSEMVKPSSDKMSNDIFSSIPEVNTATLFVPSMDGYTTESWNKFSNIVVGRYETDTNEGDMTFACYTVEGTPNKCAILTKAASGITEALIEDKVNSETYTVKSIGKYAFQNRKSLSKVKLPQTLTSIGYYAFDGCAAINTIISAIPNENLGALCDINDVFTADVSPKFVYIPDEDNDNTYNTWKQRFGLDKFIIGTPGFGESYVESSGGSGWWYEYLTTTADERNTATLKLAKTSITKDGVLSIPSIVTINKKPYKVTNIGSNAFNEYEDKSGVVELKIPESVTIIETSAFNSLSSLQKIWLPKKLEYIGSKAFGGSKSITHVCSEIVNPSSDKMSNDIFSSIPSVNTATLFVPSMDGYTTDSWNKFSNIVVGAYEKDTNEGEMTFACYTVDGTPNKCAILTKAAKNITEALINEKVIPDESGEKYAVTEIGKYAFLNCNSLTKVELPNSLVAIGKKAFDGCRISNIVSNIKNVFEIEDNVFTNDTYSTATVYVFPESCEDYKKTDGWKKFIEGEERGNAIVAGMWQETDFMGDKNSLKFKYHTGTQDAELIEISFPDNLAVGERKLTIGGGFKLGNIDYHVTSIAPTKITNKDKIEELIITEGNSELTIGVGAFNGCTNLSKLELPSNLTIIGARAFQGCTNLQKIELPSALRTIEASAFQNCSNLQKIWLPVSITNIGSKAFYGCNNLTRISTKAMPTIEYTDVFSTYDKAVLFIPTGELSTINDKAGWRDFSRKYEGHYVYETPTGSERMFIYLEQNDGTGTAVLTKATKADLIKPNAPQYDGNDYKVTIIGKEAFKGLNLSEWESLSDGIETIEKDAFRDCSLNELKMPSNLKTIGDGAFCDNKNLIPNLTPSAQLETIGDDAFRGCSSVTKMKLPSTLLSIGDRAFRDNSNLVEIELQNGIDKIGENAFQNCSSIRNIVLPASLTKIGANLFDGCSNLTEVISKIEKESYIENGVQSVPNAILYVPDGTADYYSTWDFLYTLEGDSKFGSNAGLAYAYTISKKSGNKAILIGVAENGIDKDGIVTIPSKVTLGDGDASAECDVIAVGKDAFRGNLKLKRLEIRASLASIGENAFSDCSNLSEIICDKYYKKLDALSQFDILLYVPYNDIKDLYVDDGWKSNRVYVGERKEKELEDGLVYSFTTGGSDAILIGITDKALDKNGAVTIPDNITFKVTDKDENETEFNVIAIANSVFKDNTDVKMVTIGKNIASIGENTFDGCTNLKEFVSKIVNPDVISSIAFSRPDAILFIPNATLFDTYKAKWGASYILVGERKAWNENGLYYVCATEDKNAVLVEGKAGEINEDVVIPSFIEFKVNEADENKTKFNVIALAENAFNGNTDIMTLKIGEYVKTIGASAFQDCIGLNKIWLPESLDSIASKVFYGCSEINYICTKRKTPLTSPGMSLDAFSTFKATTTLYVPCGTIEDYNASEIWQVCPIRKEGIFVNERSLNGLTFECVINEKDETVAHLVKAAATKNVDIPSFVQLKNDEAKYMVTTICTDAFKDCKNVETIVLPESLESIAENVFAQCTKLSIITSKISKDNLFGFKKNVFPNDIYEKATVYIPYDEDGSTKAKYMAADGWKEFDNWAQGEKKTGTIGSMTYEYIVGVGTATLTGTSVDKEDVTIDGTVEIDGETYTVTAIAESAFKNNPNRGKMTKLRIAKNITTIGAYAFQGCSNLKMVWLPTSITSIGEKAFDGCNGITHVSSNIESPAENEANYFPNNATLYVPKGGKDKYNVSGWNNVSYVAEGEFVDVCTDDNVTYDCLTIDDTKKAILRKYAASSNDVVIPDSVKLGEDYYKVAIIGKSAFANKTTITSLVIPAGVEEIDADVFSGCSKLTWIESKIESPIDISGKNVFANNTATLFIPSDKVLSDYRAKGWDFLNIYVGDRKETTIDGWTYVYSTGDKKAILSKATNVGKDVTINGSLKIDNEDYTILAISEAVFKGKTNIENLTISENVEDIGANAFQGCQNIEKVEFPSTLKAIGDNAFDQCSKLTIITNKSKTPAVLGKDVFVQSIYSTATVYVPNDAEIEAKYKAADGWKDFTSWAHGEKKTGTVGSMTYDYLVGVGTATLTGTTVDKEDVTIDGTVEIDGVTYTVTAIAESAFKNNPNRGKMTKLRIAKNITTIGAYAFQSCSNLKMVWLPTSITSIGEKAFDGCNGITHVSSSIESPAENEANYFPNNATLYVPKGGKDKYNVSGWNNVSYVAEGEFVDVCTDDNVTYDCLTIDDTKKAILRKYAASSNDVVIPDSVKLGEDYYKVSIIGKSAFANKTSITSLIIPSGVEGIDADVFSGCSKLTWIESKIESPIDISGKNVFANNTATLFIPKDKVADYRAKGWDFLNIYVGDRKETTIDGWTYVYSTDDKKAILTKVNSVGKDVSINGSFKIGKDEYTVTAIAEAVFKGKTNIENLTVSENIENIGANAFHGCEKIEKVELPSTLKVIGDNAFDGCSRLVSITCNGATPATVGADAFPSYNLTLNVSSDAVEIYKKDATWGQFTTILGIVTSISDEDADDNTADYVDTTPSEDGANPTVTLVDGSDVHDTFAIPETVLINNIAHVVTAIGANAFKNNTNLKEVTISSNITSIGESAFEGCKNLASITVDIVVPLDLSAPATTRGKITRSGGSSIFEGVDKKTCILYVPSGSVDAYKAAPVWGDFENILPIGTTAINGVIVSDNDKPFDVYNMQGRKVKENTTTLKGLPSGIYIVNGKKLMVK